MSGLPFNYSSPSRLLATDVPRTMSVSPTSSMLSSSPSSQTQPPSQVLPSPPGEFALAARAYHQVPSHYPPNFFASSQQGAIISSPSQFLGSQSGFLRQTAIPRPISQRIKREPSIFGSPSSLQPLPLSQSYGSPYQQPLPSEYTNPYPAQSYSQYPAAQAPNPMYMIPKVEYLFPQEMMVKIRPETLSAVLSHVNWTGWLRSRQPRAVMFPPEVVRNILRHLGYFDLIRLARVNKDLFYNHVRAATQACPDDEKTACIVEAENTFRQHFPGKKGKEPSPGNFGCYYCFKVLSYECFEHLPWNSGMKEANSDDEADGPEVAPLGMSRPVTATKQEARASPAANSQRLQLPSTTTSPTMTTLTKSSRQSSVASLSPATNYYDSPRHSVASSPPLSSLHTPIQRNQALSSTGSYLDPSTPTGSGRKRTRLAVELDEDNLALRRIKLHQDKRRFCIECGVKNRFYSPGDLIEPNKIGKQKNAHNALWVCKCYRLQSQLKTPSCHECGGSAPYNNSNRHR